LTANNADGTAVSIYAAIRGTYVDSGRFFARFIGIMDADDITVRTSGKLFVI
jgi:hypothetical protein